MYLYGKQVNQKVLLWETEFYYGQKHCSMLATYEISIRQILLTSPGILCSEYLKIYCYLYSDLGGFPPALSHRTPPPPASSPRSSSPPRSFPPPPVTLPTRPFPPPPPPVSTNSFSPALFPRPSCHPVFMLNPRDRKKQNGVLECHALLKNEIHRC